MRRFFVSGDPWAGPLLLQLVLIFLSACYAAAEVALLSLNATKLHHDAEEGDPTAAKLLRITDAPARTLSTIQVCITLFGFWDQRWRRRSLHRDWLERFFLPGLASTRAC